MTSAPASLANRRGAYVVGTAAIGLAVAGFFTGVGQERRWERSGGVSAPSASAPTPGYRDLRALRLGPNAALYAGAFERLAGELPNRAAEVPEQTESMRASVLTERATHRAYDGAPPVIPHAVPHGATSECLACHERGAMIAGKRAPAMSHARRESCTQCHAPTSPAPGPAREPLTTNTFVGLESPARGARAWPGAPPTIPHSTRMRETCGSCHGVAGALGMRSSHPWRESCVQCHAPAAALDQRSPVDLGGRTP